MAGRADVVLDMDSSAGAGHRKGARITGTLHPSATTRCFCSTSTATAWPPRCGLATCIAPTTGPTCSCRKLNGSTRRARAWRSARTPRSRSRRSTTRSSNATWTMPSACRRTRTWSSRSKIFSGRPGCKTGKQATHVGARLSCHRPFQRERGARLSCQLSVLAYNLGNLWRRLVLPPRIKRWSLTSLQQRLVKTGGRLVKHARYYWLLLAEGHLTRRLFGDMLRRIWALPVPAG